MNQNINDLFLCIMKLNFKNYLIDQNRVAIHLYIYAVVLLNELVKCSSTVHSKCSMTIFYTLLHLEFLELQFQRKLQIIQLIPQNFQKSSVN